MIKKERKKEVWYIAIISGSAPNSVGIVPDNEFRDKLLVFSN